MQDELTDSYEVALQSKSMRTPSFIVIFFMAISTAYLVFAILSKALRENDANEDISNISIITFSSADGMVTIKKTPDENY